MARLLFAAHDPGGALMIGAAAIEVERRGHVITYAAAGPAVDLWRRAGHTVMAFDGSGDFAAVGGLSVDAVVAGTGFGGFEQAAWQWARRAGVRSLGAIDSWTHLMRRFETPKGRGFPDVVAVIDQGVAADLRAEAGAGVGVAIVGQPHLEAQTARLLAAREHRRPAAGPPALVFFSEPIIEDFGPGTRGFEQFEVFEMAVRGLAAAPAKGLALTVKPHPREALTQWQAVATRLAGETGIAITVSSQSAEDLLAAADGVIGMTTMVLLEAHLAQVPVLSLQPARTGILNPVIDHASTVVTDGAAIAAEIASFLVRLGTMPPVNPRLRAGLDDASNRFADAVEQRLLC